MTLDEVIRQLDADAAGRKRVMMGPLRALGKKIRKDQTLALALWATGRTDARLLATMVMVPEQVTASEAEPMLASLQDVQLVDELAGVVARSPGARDLGPKWRESPDELTARAGWNLLVTEIVHRRADCPAILDTIEARTRAVPTRTAESMMRCLVEIGLTFPEHRERALAIGERWGVIDDRPVPRGCTPFHAVRWIEARLARKK